MSEQFNHQPADRLNEIARAFDNSFFEVQYKEAQRIAVECQRELALAEDDEERRQIIEKFTEDIAYMDVVGQDITLTAHVRPHTHEQNNDLRYLAGESQLGDIGQDEDGKFVYLTGATGFRIQQPQVTFGPAGPKAGFVIEDEFERTFKVNADDIFGMENADGNLNAQYAEVVALLPEAAQKLETLDGNETNEALLEKLQTMQFDIAEKNLHEPVGSVARKLGRCATVLANLDSAPQNLQFSGSYSVLNERGEYSPLKTSKNISITGDVPSISYTAHQKAGEDAVLFRPELDVMVALPGKEGEQTGVRIPVANVQHMESTRLQSMDLFKDEPVDMLGLQCSDADQDEIQTPKMLQRAVQNRWQEQQVPDRETEVWQKLEAMRAMLEHQQQELTRAFMYLKNTQKRVFDTPEEAATVIDLSDIDAALRNTGGYPLTYMGGGVIAPEQLDDPDVEPMHGVANGVYRGVASTVVPAKKEGKYRPEIYIALGMSEESNELTDAKTYNAGSQVVPLEWKYTTYVRQSVVVISESDSAPRITLLDDMKRRDEVIESVADMFSDDQLAANDIAEFAHAINKSMLGEEADNIALDSVQNLLTDEPRYANKVASALSECLPAGGTRTLTEVTGLGVHQGNQSEIMLEDSRAILLDIAVYQNEDGEDEVVCIFELEDEKITVPLEEIDDIRVMGILS